MFYDGGFRVSAKFRPIRFLLTRVLQLALSISRDQEKIRGQRGQLGHWLGYVNFTQSIFRQRLNGSRFPETSANGHCDVTRSHRSVPTSHCVMAAVKYSVWLS